MKRKHFLNKHVLSAFMLRVKKDQSFFSPPSLFPYNKVFKSFTGLKVRGIWLDEWIQDFFKLVVITLKTRLFHLKFLDQMKMYFISNF